jgi:acyl-coenzyme A thioesterase PaaI-like protein
MTAAPLTQAQLDAFAASWNEGAVVRHHGFLISYPRGERAVITLAEVQEHHRGGLGADAVNGGILASMFDFAIGCTSVLAPPLRRSATIQISMSFERAVRGDSVRCEARIERTTGTLLFVTAEAIDAKEVVCSRATGIVSLGKPIDLDGWTRTLV